jgi:hypothetical protein
MTEVEVREELVGTIKSFARVHGVPRHGSIAITPQVADWVAGSQGVQDVCDLVGTQLMGYTVEDVEATDTHIINATVCIDGEIKNVTFKETR